MGSIYIPSALKFDLRRLDRTSTFYYILNKTEKTKEHFILTKLPVK